jgi:Putative Ig domain
VRRRIRRVEPGITLAAGLSFNATTGAISGTPSATSAAASYVVTAQNAGGQMPVTLTIEVD